jgi:hypothetical protein
LDFLAEELKAHPNYIRQKMFYWLHKGVVKEEKANVRGSSTNNGLFNSQTNAYFKNIGNNFWPLKKIENMYQGDSIVYF